MSEQIKYKNYTIEIHNDLDPVNPFSEWDCLPDLIVRNDDHITKYGDIDYNYLPGLSREQIKANIGDILRETETTSLLNLMAEHGSSYLCDYGNGVEAVNDALQSFYDDMSDSGKLEFLGVMLHWTGIVALCTSVTGHCQGDYAELLIIASQSFLERAGATINNPDDLRQTAELYRSWAYGDVYGYTVSDPNGKETDASCWGFYGYDHDESGLMGDAKSTIDCIIKEAA